MRRNQKHVEKIPMNGYSGVLGGGVAALPVDIRGEQSAMVSAPAVSCALYQPDRTGELVPHPNEAERHCCQTNPTSRRRPSNRCARTNPMAAPSERTRASPWPNEPDTRWARTNPSCRKNQTNPRPAGVCAFSAHAALSEPGQVSTRSGFLDQLAPKKRPGVLRPRAAGLGGGRLNPCCGRRRPRYEQPVVEPQVSHFRQVPLRTRVKLAQLGHGSPS
jgi:hypothetical protein